MTSVARPLEMETRDAGSCHNYPSLLSSRPAPPPLDISTYISTGDAMPFVISLFLDFIIFSMKIREDFENRD